MKLCVVGLGRLGLAWALAADASGHRVRGLDVDRRRVAQINERSVDTREPGIAELLGDRCCGLTATLDPAEALADADVSVVTVPTPSQADGSFELGAALAAIEAIGEHALRRDPRHVVVLKSTVSPGATEGPVRARLAAAGGVDDGPELGLVYAPEFHAIGSVVRDVRRPHLVVLGGRCEWALARAETLHVSLADADAPSVARLDAAGAELTKLASNSFRTTKIAFANALSELCAAYGSDPSAVCEAVGADPHVGRGYLAPGMPYGGPCYPRDNPALIAAATAVGVPAPLPAAVEHANERRFQEIERAALAAAPGTVGIVGAAFKEGVDELEGSSALKLARRLLAAGREVVVHDEVAIADGFATAGSLAQLIDACGVLVLAVRDEAVAARLDEALDATQRAPAIVDPWCLLRRQRRRADGGRRPPLSPSAAG